MLLVSCLYELLSFRVPQHSCSLLNTVSIVFTHSSYSLSGSFSVRLVLYSVSCYRREGLYLTGNFYIHQRRVARFSAATSFSSHRNRGKWCLLLLSTLVSACMCLLVTGFVPLLSSSKRPHCLSSIVLNVTPASTFRSASCSGCSTGSVIISSRD